MKKIFCTLIMFVACIAIEAKVVTITLMDGSVKVFTCSQLSAIDFNDDGTLTVTTYDGKEVPALDVDFGSIAIDDEPMVSEVYPDTLKFNIDADGIPVDLHSERPIMKMNYVYPSFDPWGEPITLSGTILFPEEVWNKTVACEGIMMVNHYTKFHRNEAPTISNGELENMLLANPLKPNYIIVESDFYGFGVTECFPQAFMQGLVNARASLDGLMAARQLLEEQGFDYGPLCFNLGYSSGGFDALAAQKLRDMDYSGVISFDKTFSGGSPSDVREAYRQYVLTDSTAYNAVPLLLMVTTNEIQRLGIDYADVFQPYLCNRIDELILSKNYSSWPVCDSIGREKKIHEILTPLYCDLASPESMAMQEFFTKFSLTTDDGWTPDTTQRIYLFHSRGDDYVPIKSARPMVAFLKSKGLKPSVIPGKTNFQTNFVVPKLGHLSATLVYFIQTIAAIKAWPMMYTDNQLNPGYQAVISKDVDIVGTMRQLDVMGFDCRALINKVAEYMSSLSQSGETPVIDMTTLVATALSKLNLTEQDLLEMSEDSGMDIQKFLIDLITYLYEPTIPTEEQENQEAEDAEAEDSSTEGLEAKAMRRLNRIGNKAATPRDKYEQQLRNWLEENGVAGWKD
ncbi:MAG: hypothetical protein IJS97_02010 [Prevotella sp.]|nr:hypothetical protein [Prevotella sp.]